MGRVLGGGLLAGLLMNLGEAALHAGVLGKPAPKDLWMLIALTLAQGVAMVWLYAAIRPRFGPGPKTAICAGLAVWFFSAVHAAVYLYAGFEGMAPDNVVWLPVAWGFVQFPLAALAGAWLYRE
jgi:hypothetical protein